MRYAIQAEGQRVFHPTGKAIDETHPYPLPFVFYINYSKDFNVKMQVLINGSASDLEDDHKVVVELTCVKLVASGGEYVLDYNAGRRGKYLNNAGHWGETEPLPAKVKSKKKARTKEKFPLGSGPAIGFCLTSGPQAGRVMGGTAPRAFTPKVPSCGGLYYSRLPLSLVSHFFRLAHACHVSHVFHGLQCLLSGRRSVEGLVAEG